METRLFYGRLTKSKIPRTSQGSTSDGSGDLSQRYGDENFFASATTGLAEFFATASSSCPRELRKQAKADWQCLR